MGKSTEEASRDILAILESLSYFQAQTKLQPKAAQLGPSFTLSSILEEAARVSSAHNISSIFSEYLLIGIFVEGTSVGAEIISRYSKGAARSYALLEDVGLKPALFLRDATPTFQGTWSEFTATVPKGWGKRRSVSWYPKDLPDLRSFPKSPTPSSNWLIPDVLCIGASPRALRWVV